MLNPLEYRIGEGVNSVIFGSSEAEIEASIGTPRERNLIESLGWIPEDMREAFHGMVITEHHDVYGGYVFQLTYLRDRLSDIKILPDAGPVLIDGIDLFGPRHDVLAALFKRFGLPLDLGSDLYFVEQGLLYSIEDREFVTVNFTTGEIQKPEIVSGEFRKLNKDDIDYLTSPFEEEDEN